jgi:hypothetical protein
MAPVGGSVQFGSFDDMVPIKVDLPTGYAAAYTGGVMEMNAGEWRKAVEGVAPHLNAEGLCKAVLILDFAIKNLQRKSMLGETSMKGVASRTSEPGSVFQNAAMCAMLQVQIQEKEQQLLRELYELPFRYGINMVDPAALGFGMLPCYSDPSVCQMPAEVPWAAADPATIMPTMPEHNAKVAEQTTLNANASKASSRRRMPQTLSTSLRLLENEDADCLLIVRRIGKLGFKATRSLKNHFKEYGPVVKVLLAHSTARQYCDQQFQVKRRPSNLGFIQMGTAEATRKVLEAGPSQEIEGVQVCVQRFERHEDAADDDDEDHVAELEATDASSCRKHGRSMSGHMSDVSTAGSTSPMTRQCSGESALSD